MNFIHLFCVPHSSFGHEATVPGGIDFDTLNDSSKSDTVTRYGRSKLANVLFAKALARRLVQEEVYVNVVHPGYVLTELNRDEPFSASVTLAVKLAFRLMGMPPRQGALTQLYLATSPEVINKDIRGRYFIPIANEILPSVHARDKVLQEKLWGFSEKIVKDKARG